MQFRYEDTTHQMFVSVPEVGVLIISIYDQLIPIIAETYWFAIGDVIP